MKMRMKPQYAKPRSGDPLPPTLISAPLQVLSRPSRCEQPSASAKPLHASLPCIDVLQHSSPVERRTLNCVQVVTSAAETLLEPSTRRKYNSGLASWRRAQRSKETSRNSPPKQRTNNNENPGPGCESSPGASDRDSFEFLIGCVSVGPRNNVAVGRMCLGSRSRCDICVF